MAHTAEPTGAPIALCVGKACRKRSEFHELHAMLTGVPHLETRCLDVCKGPVVVVFADSDDEIVLGRVRSPKQRRDLARVIVDGHRLSERLERRNVTGTKRRTALRRLHRSVRRYR